MKLGYTHVERYAGGDNEWTQLGRFLEVSDRARIEALVNGGALVIDTSGQFPGAVHVSTTEIVADPAGAIGTPPAETWIVLMGAAAPTGGHYDAARALEEAGYFLTNLYAEGYAGWAGGG